VPDVLLGLVRPRVPKQVGQLSSIPAVPGERRVTVQRAEFFHQGTAHFLCFYLLFFSICLYSLSFFLIL
jgi:hypothetical protein